MTAAAEGGSPAPQAPPFEDPYSEEALAALMANPGAAFRGGSRAVQNSPTAAGGGGGGGAERRRTPRAAKKTAADRHAELWGAAL
jgi:hypothetical protein